jgi:phosphoglycolate phosphatase
MGVGVCGWVGGLVGDSIARDILMSKRADIFSIWAAYGAQHDPEQYSQLVRISHWTSDEIARELRLKEEAKDIRPDFIARTSFAEVLMALDIKPRSGRATNY